MRKYLLNFFLVVLLVLLPALFFSWWAQPIYGDLTRIGYWSEHDFGPRAMSPTIHVRASGRALSNADVWVLGDSFTVLNLWQSVLSDNTGHVVKSFQYGNNCLDNWIASAIAEPASKIIIVEAVEREFINQFSKTSSCPHSDMVPSEVQAELKESFRPTWPPTLSLSYVITTAMNTAELNISHKNLIKNFMVVNAPLRVGCARFSNRRNDRLLYYANDDSKQEWNMQEIQHAVANILRIQREVERSGKRFILIVAPDKSSAYQNCLLSSNETKYTQNINDILIASGVHAPNLLTPFKQNINTIIDLYDPDNTHWSEAGYILAGNEISKYLSKPTH